MTLHVTHTTPAGNPEPEAPGGQPRTALTLIHSGALNLSKVEGRLHEANIEVREFVPSDAGELDDTLTVLLVDSILADSHGEALAGAVRGRLAIITVGLDIDHPLSASAFLVLPGDPPAVLLLSSIRGAFQQLAAEHRASDLEQRLRVRDLEIRQINEVGIALSAMRDHSRLLDMILLRSRELSRADAGSLYLLEESESHEGAERVLRWKLAQNDSIPVSFEEKLLPITKKSLAGFVALTGETLVIDDAYNLPADVEYTINRSFDLETGYRTKSMLVIPMMNHRGDLIGVLQLINRKRHQSPEKLQGSDFETEVVPFDEHTIDLMRSLAGQAAVAVENSILYESIERLFEGFVTAAVTAIEQRDPTTSGHSFRVADLTVELAKVVDSIPTGRYGPARFSVEQIKELRYASLLHDFGKVGVREEVLVKEKKLFPMQLEVVQGRFHFMMKAIEADYQKRKLEYLVRFGRDGYDQICRELDDLMRTELAEIRRDLELILESNEPTVLPEGEFNQIQKVAQKYYRDALGRTRSLLTPEEARVLSIRKGSLDPRERLEIESHVTHTFEFLSKIPWTRELSEVANYAYAHHEKLNGKGYPRQLEAPGIPLQSRMMTVSDIYDALTASDRPYKRAIGTDAALDILYLEVREGMLDEELVHIFAEAKVFERALGIRG